MGKWMVYCVVLSVAEQSQLNDKACHTHLHIGEWAGTCCLRRDAFPLLVSVSMLNIYSSLIALFVYYCI